MATATVLFVHELTLVPITTPAYSPQSNGPCHLFRMATSPAHQCEPRRENGSIFRIPVEGAEQMPGLSLVCRKTGVDAELDLRSLTRLLRHDSYSTSLLFHSPHLLMACTKYPQYPTLLVEDAHYVVYLEGRIYGISEARIPEDLLRLARLICDSSSHEADVTRWLLDTPGEFLIAAFSRASGRLVILNDALGHLPLYYRCSFGTLVTSRDLRFVSSFERTISFDRASLAEYLLFSYPLEQRTLIANVYRLPPATAILVDVVDPQVSLRTYHRFDFEQRHHANLSLAENSTRLCDLLVQQCRAAAAILPHATHVLSLSGGLDSRVVLGAMTAAGISFRLATRRDQKSVREGDVSVARQLSRALGKQWSLIDPKPPRFDDAICLLKLKAGMNYLPMSFLLPYLNGLRALYGPDLVYWSGDTGLVLRRHLPKASLRNEDQLVDLVLQRQGILALEDVSALLRTAPAVIRQQLKSVLRGFPERSLEQRYVHFVVAGRIMKWHYEGMDRNRCFFSTCAPLEFTPFFDYAMNCPEEQKTNDRLYRELLVRLCPELAVFPAAPRGVAPSSRKYALEMTIRSWFHAMPPQVGDLLRAVLGRGTVRPRPCQEIEECLRRQVLNSGAVREWFSPEEVERFLQRCDHLSAKLLLTVTSIIELYSSGETALAHYAGEDFT